jgi:hypothetical protein
VERKGEILLRHRELLASSFDPRLCGKKTTTATIVLIAPILPLMAANRRTPAAIRANLDTRHSDKSATI